MRKFTSKELRNGEMEYLAFGEGNFHSILLWHENSFLVRLYRRGALVTKDTFTNLEKARKFNAMVRNKLLAAYKRGNTFQKELAE